MTVEEWQAQSPIGHTSAGRGTPPLADSRRYSAWLVTTSITWVTTMMLFHVQHVLHPFTLLLIHTISAAILRAAIHIWNGRSRDAIKSVEYEGGLSRVRSAIVLLPNILAWIITYSALRSTHNPFVVIMLASLQLYQPTAYEHQLGRYLVKSLITSLLFLVAVLFILRYDYRLTPEDIAEQLLTVIFACAAHIVRRVCKDVSAKDNGLDLGLPSIIISVPVLSILAALEYKAHQNIILRLPTYELIAMNVISGALSIVLGGHSSLPLYYDVGLAPEHDMSTIFSSPMLAGVIGVAYHTFARDSMLPIQQLLAYALASMCVCYNTIGLPWSKSSATTETYLLARTSESHDEDVGYGAEIEVEEDNVEHDSPSTTHHCTRTRMAGASPMLVTVLTCITWTFLLLQSVNIVPPLLIRMPAARLERDESKRSVDIVVSYYEEPIASLVQNLEDILSIKQLLGVHRRVYIYNKGDETAHTSLETEVADVLSDNNTEVQVHDELNRGRESETYLTHILLLWDRLATHTIFMQAELHEPDRAMRHLKDYFVSDTGFLSLSYSSNFCRDCYTCKDLSWWQADPGDIEWIYDQAHPGRPCQNIPLTYRGQFVASGARIRGGGKDMYHALREALLAKIPDEQSNSTAINPRDEGMNTEFGYVMERTWGVVMQCAEERIADRCPSLFSNQLGRLGSVDDCQCLDYD